ncbi:hypothetical protein BDV37DRAFT_284625 [Aspergillus pseudonomiae]|uniref:F-box domain-containing protein n=1 Tax=Aspergillus pseudonomiae TaxID=1506151 RepID=A0A5N7D7R4_9EURO|nr:uncharacterized protein BDV37DRAFT_284625 [Aspergillus pseudonomiae]KAE8402490.1 hypothetical protein BDV37DRAFT_284625 [Aspergillus pseudonomiae]
MAPLTLDSLPMELIETVINFLDFQDLCALRLTAHGISAKSSNGRFRQNLKSKRLHIAQAPLEDFAHFTQPGQVGCALQHLTLSDFGVANASDKCLEAAKLLVQGMENLRQNTSHGGLVSLSLSLHEPIDSELEEAEHATAKLFDLVMLALSNSKLSVQIVDIFAKCFPIRCALACGEIMAVMEKADLSSTFRECKELCLSLSHWLRDLDEHYESPLSFDQARDHTRCICDFVNMFPVLEELHLAWVYYDLAYTDAIQEEEHFFNRIANSCPFPLLKKCTFHNIRTTEAALLQFLKNVQLASLSMENVYLVSGRDPDCAGSFDASSCEPICSPSSFHCSKGLRSRSYQDWFHNATDGNNTESDSGPKLFLGKRAFKTLTLADVRKYVANSYEQPDPYFGQPLEIIEFDDDGESTDASGTQQVIFGSEPFQIGTDSLTGCTIVTVVSKRAVYMGHYWENPSWGNAPKFTRNVLNFIAGRTPRSGVGPTLDPALFNAQDDDTRIYLMHPRLGQKEHTSPYKSPRYWKKFEELKNLLNTELLPGAATASWFYITAETSREVPAYRRHAIFQYDPVAHGRNKKGWRLFYEDHYFDDTNPPPGPESADGIPDL